MITYPGNNDYVNIRKEQFHHATFLLEVQYLTTNVWITKNSILTYLKISNVFIKRKLINTYFTAWKMVKLLLRCFYFIRAFATKSDWKTS